MIIIFSLLISVMSEALFGVLVDVSGSMSSAYALDTSTDASVQRTHAIFTTIMNIVKREVIHHHRQESIFACAFGLRSNKCGHGCPGTCDLIPLFDCPKDGYQALVELALAHNAPQTEKWIKDALSPQEAQILYVGLQRKPNLIRKLVHLIPSQTTTAAFKGAEKANSYLEFIGLPNVAKRVSNAAVTNSEAYELSHNIIDSIWQEKPFPRAVQVVCEQLDNLLKAPSSSQFSQDKIHEFIEQIKPFIYGNTPMCKALTDARDVFQESVASPKVLFILSDGISTDGDPLPIAQELHHLGVIIVTCFLTSYPIDNPRQLLYEADPHWSSEDGQSVLFKMSSTMPNTHAPISYLTDANWTLPTSGESRLFIEANSLDVVNEFCKIVVSQMAERCDALVHILETVDLATYINQTNTAFEPKEQKGGTCYANAVAAVCHLAMHRIVGREGGYPDFFVLRQLFIDSYGENGANTMKVLGEVCPVYRLHFKEVDETGARQAINKR